MKAGAGVLAPWVLMNLCGCMAGSEFGNESGLRESPTTFEVDAWESQVDERRDRGIPAVDVEHVPSTQKTDGVRANEESDKGPPDAVEQSPEVLPRRPVRESRSEPPSPTRKPRPGLRRDRATLEKRRPFRILER